MKILGHRVMKIGTIKLPGDMRARMELQRVQKLAASFRELGQLQEPIVRHCRDTAKHYTLIAGRDRMAAHMILNHAEVEICLVECTDEEARRAELAENGHRRHSEDEQRAALEELEAVQAAAEEALLLETAVQPTKREIRKVAAATLDILPETLERKERELKKAVAKMPTVNFNTWGLTMQDEWIAHVDKVHVAMTGLADAIRRALVASTFLQDAEMVPPGVCSDVRQTLQQVGHLVRANIPVALCPYCKGQDDLIETCGSCLGTGWVGKGKLESAPAPLCDATDAKVWRDGQCVSLTETEEPWFE